MKLHKNMAAWPPGRVPRPLKTRFYPLQYFLTAARV